MRWLLPCASRRRQDAGVAEIARLYPGLLKNEAKAPITKAILELFQLLGDGKFIASALGVWAMLFLGVTIVSLSLLLGKRLGAIFRV